MIKQLKTLALAIGLVAGLSFGQHQLCGQAQRSSACCCSLQLKRQLLLAARQLLQLLQHPQPRPRWRARRKPLRLKRLVGPRRHRGQGHFAHLGAHVHGLLVRDHHQVL